MALVNLISAVLTALLGLGMALSFLTGKKKGLGKARLWSLIPAVGAVATFLLTEALGGPVTLVDKWTPAMLGMLAANGVIAYLTRNIAEKVGK